MAYTHVYNSYNNKDFSEKERERERESYTAAVATRGQTDSQTIWKTRQHNTHSDPPPLSRTLWLGLPVHN